MARLLIDGFVIDGQVRVVPTQASEATEFPVEDGSDLTDHVRKLPFELEIEGIVTDTPIGGMVDIRAAGNARAPGVLGPDLPPNSQSPVALAEAHFERITDLHQPITVQTTRKLYERMVMTNFTSPQDETTGKAIRFTASFRQIKVVTNTRTPVRTAAPRGGGVKKLGAKPAKDTKTVDELNRGQRITWRRASVPGGPPPFEIVTIYRKRRPDVPVYYFEHENGAQLTEPELDAFLKDATRDTTDNGSGVVMKPDGSIDTARSKIPRNPRAFRDS